MINVTKMLMLELMRIEIQIFASPETQNPDAGTYGVSEMNRTTDAGLSPEMKSFYDTALLQNARAALVFNQFGKEVTLPKRHGKTVEFRRFKTFEKALAPLVEGVIPTGHKMEAQTVTANVEQYGDYVPISDQLEFAAVDPILGEAVKENGAQAGETGDTLTRNVISAGTNIYFGSDVKNEICLGYGDGGDNITSAMVARAATILKKTNTPKINGKYYAVIHPSVSYDLMQDSGWIDAHKYASPKEIYNGEIGELHGVRFLETTEALIEKTTLAVNTTANSGATSVVVDGVWGENFSGKSISAELQGAGGVYITDVTITGCSASENGKTSTLTVAALSQQAAKGMYIVVKKAHYTTLFFGFEAYGRIKADGMSLESIIKDKSYGGPLNQFSTVGWKMMHAAVILYPERILSVMTGSSSSDIDDPN